MYVQWIYGGGIFTRPGRGGVEDKDKATYSETSLLVEGLIFGEKIQDGDFKDAILDAIIVSINDPGEDDLFWYPSRTTVERAYEGTPEGLPLRKLMIDIHAHHGSRQWLDGLNYIEFVKDLVGELFVGRQHLLLHNPSLMHSDGCQYHHHGEYRSCYSAAS